MPHKAKKSCNDYPLAKSARVVNDNLRINLRDGRVLTVPLKQFPELRLAPAKARRKVRAAWGGTGIDWPDLRFELGVGGLVRQCQNTKGCSIRLAR